MLRPHNTQRHCHRLVHFTPLTSLNYRYYSALRTPLTKAKRGGLKDSRVEDMVSAVLKGILTATRIDPALVDDITVGNVLAPGCAATVSRMAALHAGFPPETAVSTVNRQCSSGLQAISSVATAIHAGLIRIGIGTFDSL